MQIKDILVMSAYAFDLSFSLFKTYEIRYKHLKSRMQKPAKPFLYRVREWKWHWAFKDSSDVKNTSVVGPINNPPVTNLH